MINKTEFNLSEKEEYIDERGENEDLVKQKVYKKKDVKEFIKLLKEEFKNFCAELNGEYDLDTYVGISIEDIYKFNKMINTLVGEKLK